MTFTDGFRVEVALDSTSSGQVVLYLHHVTHTRSQTVFQKQKYVDLENRITVTIATTAGTLIVTAEDGIGQTSSLTLTPVSFNNL